MLTDAHVRKIKPLEKKKRYADEKGLYLEVTPSGGRFWRGFIAQRFEMQSAPN